MSVSSELPEKCQKCARSEVSIIHDKCNFCRELEFYETILCDLNRCIQDHANFSCHAFQPILKLAGPSQNNVPDLSGGSKERLQREPFLRLLHSGTIEYERALAFQKLDRDPDGVFMEIKYHFVWNVIHRRPVFCPANDIIEFVHDTFLGCSELVRGFVSLLWLAPDHLHLYVESDGERSVETMVQEIKRFSKSAILAEPFDIRERLDAGNEIWDAAYFSETVG